MRTKWNFRVCGLLVLVLLCLVARPGEAQWREVVLPTNAGYSPRHMAWADSLRGFVFALENGNYWRTVDGGETWLPDTLLVVMDSLLQREKSCNGVEFFSKDFGAAVFSIRWSDDSLIYCTTNGGVTWVRNTIKRNMQRIFIIDTGPMTRVGEGGMLYHLYNRIHDDGVVVKELLRSTDCGATWHVFATDSLSMDLLGGGNGFEWYYVTLDSLTHYYAANQYSMDEFVRSFVRYTTDGGRTWHDPEAWHPLAEVWKYWINDFRVNGSSMMISQGRVNNFTGTTLDFALLCKDVRAHRSPDAWVKYVHPYSGHELSVGKWVKNAIYDNGRFIIQAYDSLLIFRDNPPERAWKTYVPRYQRSFSTWLQPDGKVWNGFDSESKKRGWVLDPRVLGVEDASQPPSVGTLQCYPLPLSRSAGVLNLRVESPLRRERVRIALRDITGRLLYEHEAGAMEAGMTTLHLELPIGLLRRLPASAVLLLEIHAGRESLARTVLITQ